MRNRALWLIGVTGAAGTAVALLGGPPAHASASGPVPSTGGFGEETCRQCHWENPLNDPAGALTVEGVPARYTPGEDYPITVSVRRPGLIRAGFQLSAREEGINMNAGSDAGVLASTNGMAEGVTAGPRGVTYMQHTAAGAAAVTGDTARWTFTWTAPDGEVPVAFHVAANASNGDDSPLGDWIYTAAVNATPGR